MRPLIPASAYHSPERYAQEMDRIFSRCWLFAGLSRDLGAADDYVLVNVAGHSVVVQNFAGQLRAFRNVCSHRFAQLKSECRGNGPLRCPYHGWMYDEKGVPYSIPSRPRFDDLPRERTPEFALVPYSVARCGGLVFVRASAAGPSLEEALGAATFERIARMSESLGEQIDRNEMTIEANWKITVENTLESYHVGFIHTDTFKKLGASGMNFSFEGPHSAWQANLTESVAAQMAKLLPVFGEGRYDVTGYFHQHVFPNFTVATTYGTSFALQLFEPAGPGRTRFVSIVFQAVIPSGSRRAEVTAELLRTSVAEFNRSVFEEDRVICEAVQRGVVDAEGPGILSTEEERVGHFQRAYASYMSGRESAADSGTAQTRATLPQSSTAAPHENPTPKPTRSTRSSG
jgi:phenylpropionate dioxygenase-like ring-hydroxylating dioxygenase large terminal subunit